MPPRRKRSRSGARSGLSGLPLVFQVPWLRYSVATVLFVSLAWFLPRWWFARDGHRWYDGDSALVLAHARAVVAVSEAEASADDAAARGGLVENQRRFEATHYAALALLQICLESPEKRAEFLPAAERMIEAMSSERLRLFDTERWGEDALATLETGRRGHAVYLGQLNLVLSLHRRIAAESKFAALNDRISGALASRLVASRHGIVETFPGESYPGDNAAVLASLLLHQRVAGASHATAVGPLLARFRLAWRDSHSGLLHHALDPQDGRSIGEARASATARAAFYLAYAEREVARDLYETTRDRCADAFIGFGYIKEFYVGPARRLAEPTADTGTMMFGLSPSAAGFGLGAARRFDERRHFIQLYRTAHLAGAPVTSEGRRGFAAGGALGNALLLAALTARPELP